MKIAIVHDSFESQSMGICQSLLATCKSRGAVTEMTDVSGTTVNACIGCFGCWIKTPGICIHTKDTGAPFLSKIFDADYLVFITKITWGGYSPSLKFYADRMLPLLHPYFVKRNGEMHHRLRYEKMPTLLAVGFGANSPGEEETFGRYIAAHRDNMASTGDPGAYVWKESTGVPEKEITSMCTSWFLKKIGI